MFNECNSLININLSNFKQIKMKKIKFIIFLFYLSTLEPWTYFIEFTPKYYDPNFEEDKVLCIKYDF